MKGIRKIGYALAVAVMAIAVAIPITACAITPPPQSFAVTFSLMGGNGVTIPAQIVESGSTATRPTDNPTRTGFTFQDWFTSATGGTVFNFQTPITASTTVFARWVPIPRDQVLVHFNTMQGSFIPAQLVYEGDTIDRPAEPTRDGFIFQGWFTQAEGGESFNFNSLIIVETTIFARWVEEPTTVNTALRAFPVPASETSRDPVVLESFVDVGAQRNYYLISVGRIQNHFISTIGLVHFGGTTPMTFSRTDVTETTITESLTNTVSNSVTITNTNNHTAGIQTSWENRFPLAGSFRVQLSYSWSGSWTNTQVSQSSLVTNTSEAQRVSNATSVGFTVGAHGEAAGWYRIALYSVVDVFFVLSTSLDNQELLSWEVVTVARNEFFPHFEFSSTPHFDNSPDVGAEIDLDDDFYTRLPLPEIEDPVFAHVSAGRYHTVAIDTHGQLWTWGGNAFGQLGDGTTALSRGEPARIGIATNWYYVAAGEFHNVALNSNGELWAWGNNESGRLGDGSRSHRNIPARVGASVNWSSVSAGNEHTVAISEYGELWAWGNNSQGRLGVGGGIFIRDTPMRVGSQVNWSSVSAGGSHTVAINEYGELWAWGRNLHGRLGDGTTVNRMEPVRVGLATNWSSVSAGYEHTLATTTNGQLWAWGNSANGRLGGGGAAANLAPMRIGATTNWLGVSAGNMHSAAVTTSGELWAWGHGAHGRLGNGEITDRNTPVQVDANINWASVSTGNAHTMAVTTSGELWAWGANGSGRLGDRTTTTRLAPVRIIEPWI